MWLELMADGSARCLLREHHPEWHATLVAVAQDGDLFLLCPCSFFPSLTGSFVRFRGTWCLAHASAVPAGAAAGIADAGTPATGLFVEIVGERETALCAASAIPPHCSTFSQTLDASQFQRCPFPESEWRQPHLPRMASLALRNFIRFPMTFSLLFFSSLIVLISFIFCVVVFLR